MWVCCLNNLHSAHPLLHWSTKPLQSRASKSRIWRENGMLLRTEKSGQILWGSWNLCFILPSWCLFPLPSCLFYYFTGIDSATKVGDKRKRTQRHVSQNSVVLNLTPTFGSNIKLKNVQKLYFLKPKEVDLW